MKKWDILKNILVEKLVLWWKWFAILKSDNPDLDWRTIFITGWPIPSSIVNLKVLRKRKKFIETQIVETIKKSEIELRHKNNPYWECGWCRWVNIPYSEQLKIKSDLVKEAFFPILKLQNNIVFDDIVASPLVDWYRNKVEFSFGKYISHRDDIFEDFNVWFHKQWEFSKIQDYDWCILIDDIQNIIYKEIKDYCKSSWYPVYDQKTQEGFFRHIMIRRASFTEEIMILLSFNPDYFSSNAELKNSLWFLKEFFHKLSEKYKIINSIYFSYNVNKSDTCIWDLELVYWEKTIKEKVLWLTFNISPTSFFQTNSYWAEKLYSKVLELAKEDDLSKKIVLDLYWWTWTIWMIFAKAWAKKVISVELVSSASKDWEKNAKLNCLDNIEFENKKVEVFLDEYIDWWKKADLLVIDPPRAWMHPWALPNILKFDVKQIIYVSCNPATLVRDLEYILTNSDYKIDSVTPVDMFPHTHHIETVVNLIKK